MALIKRIGNYLFAPRWHFSRFQFNLISAVLLTIGLVGGTYLTLSRVFPKALALNDTSHIWEFTTSGSEANYTYDATLVSIDPSGARPITGVNKFANPDFSSNVEGWSTSAVAPAGWVAIPGNATYDTSDFLVMKYEAKCASTTDLTTGLVSPDTGSRTYADNSTTCTAANNRAVVSVASGYPIANVSQINALIRCATITLGSGAAHLITNDEWMTIARNAEAQAGNWSQGSVGSGYLFAGHNDNSPNSARIASTTDTGNSACAFTDSAGSAEVPIDCPTNINNGTSGTVGHQKRVLTMSNGSYIWDIAGNVWEWTNNTIQGKDQPTGSTPGFAYRNFPDLTTYGTLSPDKYRPASVSYNSTHGVGRIYSDGTGSNTTSYAFLRGASWHTPSDAGAFAANLTTTPGFSHYTVGFRCASDPVEIFPSFSSTGRGAAGGAQFSVGTVADGKIYQSINVGNTDAYELSAYVKDNTAGNVDGPVSSAVAQLYYDGGVVEPTSYTDMNDGWWKLTGTVNGATSNRDYGVLAKKGKTIILDDLTLSKKGDYTVTTTLAYSNTAVASWDTFCQGEIINGICSNDGVSATGYASVKYQICLDDGSSCSYDGSSRWQYYSSGAWVNAIDTTAAYANTAAEITTTAMQALSVTTSQKIAIKAIMTFGGADTPAITNLSVGLTTDTTAPTVNASGVAMTRSNGGTSMTSNAWTNNSAPYFSWTAGADNPGGVELKGYCLYLGDDPEGDPETSGGILGTSPVDTAGSTCQFIIAGTSIDFATTSYRDSPWLMSSDTPYYLNIKAIDHAENVFAGDSAQFQFRFDDTPPTNVSHVSCPGGSFANIADMSFSWPTLAPTAATDDHSQLMGWQYQINSNTGTWRGTTSETLLGIGNYLPLSTTSQTLIEGQDGPINTGSNIVYFRAVDFAGNASGDNTLRTCSLEYGGMAPKFNGVDTVTITPAVSTTNSYALSWPAATPANDRTITAYYYVVNELPPTSLATLTGNPGKYISTGTATSVPTGALAGANKGGNIVYVVAVDDADNYSRSNLISGTFTLNSTNPDNVNNLVGSDSSIKSESKWYVTLTWTAPAYQGAGNLTYHVYRSTDGTTFAEVGTTSGLSYVDNTPSSTKYYYKVYTKDGANAQSSGTNAVSITPTGRYTSAPTLSSGPSSSAITTKKAKINWSTNRGSDSKVAFGTSKGSYNTEEPSSSDQVTDHEINLTGLTAGTTYHYKAKWTDEDGNTGESEEKSFTTAPAPTVFDVSAQNVGLTSGIIQYTVKGASKIRIYYGTTTSFGGVKEISTSNSETTYTTQLSDLSDGTKYYYKINAFDSENAEYEGTILDFTTLPRPRISGVRLETVANTAQTTIRVTWNTNTEVSSIITYYPEGNTAAARDEVRVALEKGEHSLMIRGLAAKTKYLLVVKGRDKLGNEAISDTQSFTTATDTRPPQILNLKVIGGTIPPVGFAAGDVKAQLIITWDTDEPATSQIEFDQGSGSTYSQKSQFDGNMTTNHTVILSGLVPSQVYHLRALSQDDVGNLTESTDLVTISPKATRSAFDLVIKNLSEAFSFVGALQNK